MRINNSIAALKFLLKKNIGITSSVHFSFNEQQNFIYMYFQSYFTLLKIKGFFFNEKVILT